MQRVVFKQLHSVTEIPTQDSCLLKKTADGNRQQTENARFSLRLQRFRALASRWIYHNSKQLCLTLPITGPQHITAASTNSLPRAAERARSSCRSERQIVAIARLKRS